MAKIAFLLLCHKDPETVIRQARMLAGQGDCVAIHFDARAGAEAFARIRAGLADTANVVFAGRRTRCGWGEWSLVQATLDTLEAAIDGFPRATHFYMLSADCAPIKPASHARAMLDARDVDYIESFDFMRSDWIRTGLREERLIYRHVFNERAQRRLFYASLALQKRLRLTRRIPEDIDMRIGSQWWCLRRDTVERIRELTLARRDVMRFFRTTWIPDETFFQTLVRHLVPEDEIVSRTLTFLMFSDYGMPVTFYNDHHDLLVGQDHLFARKISAEATELRDRLATLYGDSTAEIRISNEGRTLYHYLTARGREGRRFAPRFWEVAGTVGAGREVMILVCKKWHVGKRLARRVSRATGHPAVEYLFNEAATPLPYLGGIEGSVAKRTRHRRALVRMLFDYHGTDRLILCLDPVSADTLRDLCGDRATSKVLEMRCHFSDAFLAGHAMRVGLAGAATAPETVEALLPTIRRDIAEEGARIRDAGADALGVLREGDAPETQARSLARFLDIPVEKAQDILGPDDLFAD